MNVIKHLEYFNPMDVKDPVHIIGLGAIGSHIAELLTRLGIQNFHLYDFDTVTDYNLANQMFIFSDIGEAKTTAIANMIHSINFDARITVHDKGWQGNPLTGYVFICVDNIDIRKQICHYCRCNPNVKAVFDFRMRLSDAQHYAAAGNPKDIGALLNTMNFTQEEANAATPVSACGSTLSVIPTIKVITSLGVANFINFIKGQPLKKMILIDAFDFEVCAD